MSYHFLEDFATADIAFQARGSTLEEMFQSAAEATLNVMIEDLDTIQPVEQREVSLQNDALDMLLFEFLQEIIYYKDAYQLLLKVRTLSVHEDENGSRLKVLFEGEFLDPHRHAQRVDVKAVTLHHFQLERQGDGWFSQVILDI
jgi:SHS2 domain-containing protein